MKKQGFEELETIINNVKKLKNIVNLLLKKIDKTPIKKTKEKKPRITKDIKKINDLILLFDKININK